MSKRSQSNSFYRLFMGLDGIISTGLYEFSRSVRNGWAAYASWLERFRIWGIKRIFVDLLDDLTTFAMVFGVGLLAFALPSFDSTGDIWNRGREYAVTLTDINGEIIGRRGIRQDDAIPISEIPPQVIQAVLATEDSRFYKHFGVDLQGIARAMVANVRAGGVVQGGSTLTQQLAKTLFLTPDRTFRRKIHEAFLALWIEARLKKDEILKMYLDRAYLGGGTYGVEAASQFYFGKSVRDVTLSEAAMLAGLFKAPSKYAPHANIENARARANVVLYRMLDVGFITQGELLEAKQHPAVAITNAGFYSPNYFLDWAYREALDVMEKQGLTSDYVIEVKTTVDLKLQKQAQKIIDDMIDENGKAFGVHQAALVSMKPDGALKAIVGGRDYATSQFNRATDALRQPGSSFKPFVYLAALRKGYTPKTIVSDAPVSIRGWSPRNYNRRYAGRVTLTRALAKSYNSVPVHLMKAIGRKIIIDTAHRVGLQSNLKAIASLPLGTNEVTVMDITTGYATFANGGRLAKPYAVLEIRRPNGDLLYSHERNAPEAEQVIDKNIIADLNYMLGQVVTAGTGRRSRLGFTPQGGKTGTTQAYRDAWFVGFTAHFVTGVWYGNDDFKVTRRVTGGSLPAMTWKKFMLAAHTTTVAAPLPGLPLDGRYAKYVARNQDDFKLPLARTGANELRRNSLSGVPRPRLVASARTRTPRNDPVVSVLRDMFSLFDNKRRTTKVRRKKRRRSTSVFTFKPRRTNAGKRARRASANARRLKSLLESR